MLLVSEIFRSLQGESTHAGRPCVFIRLAGCNLDCTYCDTQYARKGGVAIELDELLEKIRTYRTQLVEITGGEPLLQAEATTLADKLAAAGHQVLMETNGSIQLPEKRNFSVIMDWKCPSSGMTDKMLPENVKSLTPGDELKFVIGNRQDFEYAVKTIAQLAIDPLELTVLFSPVQSTCQPRELAEWLLESGLNARFQLQLHKILWPASERGR